MSGKLFPQNSTLAALLALFALLSLCAARGTTIGVSVDPTLAVDYVGNILGLSDLSGTLGLNGPIGGQIEIPFLFPDNS